MITAQRIAWVSLCLVPGWFHRLAAVLPAGALLLFISWRSCCGVVGRIWEAPDSSGVCWGIPDFAFIICLYYLLEFAWGNMPFGIYVIAFTLLIVLPSCDVWWLFDTDDARHGPVYLWTLGGRYEYCHPFTFTFTFITCTSPVWPWRGFILDLTSCVRAFLMVLWDKVVLSAGCSGSGWMMLLLIAFGIFWVAV